MSKTKMQDLDDIIEIFESYRECGGTRDNSDDDGRVFERRPLGGKEWEETDPWTDGVNTERYEYQLADSPALRLSPTNKKMVEFNKGDATGEERSLDFVRLLSFRCRSCRKAKKELNFMTGSLESESEDEENKAIIKLLGKEAVDLLIEENDDYEVTIFSSGGIKVGCAEFEWEDINSFAKKMGWWK